MPRTRPAPGQSSLTPADEHGLAFRGILVFLDPHAVDVPGRAGPLRTGWFVESLATQTLVIFVIRTRQIPFVRSRPSVTLLAAFGVVTVGAVLPFTPLAHVRSVSGSRRRSREQVPGRIRS